MAGETWQSVFQVGKEVTSGTPVPATRIIYGNGHLTRDRATHLIEVSTGTRDQQRDAKARAVVAGGQFVQPLSADEIVELLLMSINSATTPTVYTSSTPTTDPTLSTATTGGTIPAGVYTIKYTCTTAAGESQAKTITATQTTTGSTSTITVPAISAGAPANTTAVTFYLSTPGGAASTCTKSVVSASNGSSPTTLTAPGDTVTFPPVATPATTAAWTFTPGNTLQPATVEWFDGYRNWQETGVYVDKLVIAGADDGDNMVTADLFGIEAVVNAQTPSLVSRVPDFMEGWETQLYIDPFGGTPGTTLVGSTLISWTVTLNNNMQRKYYANNTKATGAVIIGKLGMSMDLVLEANASTIAEYNNRDSTTKRLIRLAFGNNIGIGTGTQKKLITIDMPCILSTTDLTPDHQGTKVYKFHFDYITDTTNAFPLQVKLVNLRATSF